MKKKGKDEEPAPEIAETGKADPFANADKNKENDGFTPPETRDGSSEGSRRQLQDPVELGEQPLTRK